MNFTLPVIIGFLTVIIGILVKLIGFPDQFRTNYKRKSTEGLSTIFMVLALISYILWTWHGYYQKDMVLMIGQGVGIITTGMIVYQIFYYKKTKK